MADWTIARLRELDLRYASEGVHPHQRPFRAAMDILGGGLSMGVFADPETGRIMDEYRRMLPEVDANWPGMGTGLAAVVDQVRRVTAPVGFGSDRLEAWSALGFASDREWWAWCREDRDIAASTSYAFADLFDFTYGVDDVVVGGSDEPLWRMAASNLSDCANTLPGTFSVDSVVQPVCLTVELSSKPHWCAAARTPPLSAGRAGRGTTFRGWPGSSRPSGRTATMPAWRRWPTRCPRTWAAATRRRG